MKLRNAIVLVTAGMLINACNPLEMARPLETTAAVMILETETVVADADIVKGGVGKKEIGAPAKIESEKRQPTPEHVELKLKEGTEGYNPGLDGILVMSLTDVPEELYHYDTTCFYFNGEEWFLDIYTSAMYDSDGYYAYDDSNRFYIRARRGEWQYLLFDQQVQLGMPELDVYDDGKWLHVVMTDIRTASYTIIDYVYDADGDIFEEHILVDAQGINYITSLNVE